MATSSSSRSITLTESQIEDYVIGRTQGYKIRIVVAEANNMVSEIFVFQRRANPVVGGDPIDEFSNVASPSDIDVYAVGAPLPDQSYYRLDQVDLVFRSIELLEQTTTDIELGISELVRTLDQLDSLADQSQTTLHLTG